MSPRASAPPLSSDPAPVALRPPAAQCSGTGGYWQLAAGIARVDPACPDRDEGGTLPVSEEAWTPGFASRSLFQSSELTVAVHFWAPVNVEEFSFSFLFCFFVAVGQVFFLQVGIKSKLLFI